MAHVERREPLLFNRISHLFPVRGRVGPCPDDMHRGCLLFSAMEASNENCEAWPRLGKAQPARRKYR